MRNFYLKTFALSLLLLPFLLFTGKADAQSYNFDGLTAGATGTFANGWVGNPGTATVFSWRADNNGTGSSGTGPDVDHTLGNATGIYMYTEASAPAVPGDSAFLESPNLNLAAFTAPALEFWYHKAGATMGDLYIDVFNGSTWIRGVDSIIGSVQAATSDPWLQRTVSLAAFSGTIRVRFRAICGSNWSSDMAIDDVSLVNLPPHDIAIGNESILPVRYVQYPEPQSGGLSFSADLNNVGAQTVTNPTLRVTVGSWVDSASTGSLAAGASANLTTGVMPTQPIGNYTVLYEAEIDENDLNQANNTVTSPLIISDSVYARDDSVLVGSLGIGAGTPGILGQNFDINVTDTLTSVSFFLNAPTIGDTAWVTLHSFTTTPGPVIATTDTFIIPANTPGWYTLTFPCPQILTPGTYFIGMNETDQNISLGTTPFNFQPNAGWVIFGGNPWQPSEFYGFSVTYLLRANFGRYNTTVNAGTAGSDSTCANAAMVDLSTLISGNDPGGTWVDNGATGALSGTMVDPSVTGAGTFTFTYGVADQCGFSDSATVSLVVTPAPNAGQDSMVMVCDFDAAFDLTPFIGTADPGGSWSDDNSSGALSGTNFDPNASGPGIFNFTYAVSSPGCVDDSATVTVDVVICPAVDPSIPLSFSIFPNPNNGVFRLDAPGSVGQELELRITDLAGRLVYQRTEFNTSGVLEVDLSQASRGMYIVELSDGEARMQGRLIKE